MKLYQPFNSGGSVPYNLTQLRNLTKLSLKEKIVSIFVTLYIWGAIILGCSL